MTQDPVKQEDVAPGGPAADHTRKVVAILGAALFAVLVVALVMGTGMGSKETDPQAAATAATKAAPTAPAAAPPTPAGNPVPTPTPTASSPRDIAGALRRDATIACRSAQWDRCRVDLDQSARLDPEGDKVGQVQRLHRMAEQRGD
jgi:hypothetical protein